MPRRATTLELWSRHKQEQAPAAARASCISGPASSPAGWAWTRAGLLRVVAPGLLAVACWFRDSEGVRVGVLPHLNALNCMRWVRC